ncbi:hypothetical protein GPLA_3371 [Paraglaciecola polaris LMG 21857]|uniref:Uncharacterized protein n=1 Tax=Paraglaciecola polaris LMG 21857 TaxID=1129793 RepID=K7AG59_9ALTE|nr:hypothetical protein GPLA_3371 [Paraglaciecola polaris LMG 21857]
MLFILDIHFVNDCGHDYLNVNRLKKDTQIFGVITGHPIDFIKTESAQ